jgi:hypothetical protein
MEVDVEHRSPGQRQHVGMVDLDDGDRWTELGDSCAWNWQQGSMLQWLTGSAREFIWNDRMDGRFVSHILDVKTGKKRTLASSVYSVARTDDVQSKPTSGVSTTPARDTATPGPARTKTSWHRPQASEG